MVNHSVSPGNIMLYYNLILYCIDTIRDFCDAFIPEAAHYFPFDTDRK